MSEYIVEIADTMEKYLGLCNLWCRVFGDEPEFVDAFYAAFGCKGEADLARVPQASSEERLCGELPSQGNCSIRGYVICSEEGKVVSALTCHRCGDIYVDAAHEPDGIWLPVYVTYAVCTDPEYRGLGLGQKLTRHVRDIVTGSLGGISLVSPAEPSLIEYYKNLGYREGFFAAKSIATSDPWQTEPHEIEDGQEAFEPAFNIDTIDAETYNRYREEFLGDACHVRLSPEMMECVRMCSAGGDGLMLINRGDAIAALSSSDQELRADELLINPALSALSEEIGEEIAGRLAGYMGAAELVCRIPGLGSCQSMYAAPQGIDICGYYGFPIE